MLGYTIASDLDQWIRPEGTLAAVRLSGSRVATGGKWCQAVAWGADRRGGPGFRTTFGVAEVVVLRAQVDVGGQRALGSGPKRVDRVECRFEDVTVAEAGGWAEGQPPTGAHDPCGDMEHEVAKCFCRAAQRCVVGRLA